MKFQRGLHTAWGKERANWVLQPFWFHSFMVMRQGTEKERSPGWYRQAFTSSNSFDWQTRALFSPQKWLQKSLFLWRRKSNWKVTLDLKNNLKSITVLNLKLFGPQKGKEVKTLYDLGKRKILLERILKSSTGRGENMKNWPHEHKADLPALSLVHLGWWLISLMDVLWEVINAIIRDLKC